MAAIATSLVFAITLLLSGFSESFGVEVNRALNTINADGYVVREGQRGPFMSPRPFPTEVVGQVAALEGVERAEPLISVIQPDTYLMASRLDAPRTAPRWAGADRPAQGHAVRNDEELVIDDRAGDAVGDTIAIGGTDFRVAGVTKGQTVLGGQPIVVLSIAGAQRAVFGGYDVVTSVAVTGRPETVPDGYVFVTREAASRDFLRPLHIVTGTIDILSVLLWFVASAIVGSVIYISTLERMRDFAVFKATGASTRDLMAALMLQSVLLAVASSIAAIGIAFAIAPSFPAAVSFPARLLLLLPIVGVPVGLLASAAGLRRAVKVDPALAMGSPG